jgi:hypothetical protein
LLGVSLPLSGIYPHARYQNEGSKIGYIQTRLPLEVGPFWTTCGRGGRLRQPQPSGLKPRPER